MTNGFNYKKKLTSLVYFNDQINGLGMLSILKKNNIITEKNW
jgi:hypothetical protein